MQILAAAQPFGYGPITELLSILRELKKKVKIRPFLIEEKQYSSIIAKSDGIATLKSKFQNSLLDQIYYLENNPIDLVLSSYDSSAIFAAYYMGIPAHYYDGMMGYWEFNFTESLIQKTLKKIQILKEKRKKEELASLYQEICSKHYHLSVLIAYYLSSQVYMRTNSLIDEALTKIKLPIEKMKKVGAIISSSQINTKKKHVLFSLSGSLAPIIPLKKNIFFAREMLNFALKAYSTLGLDVPWYFSCHPKLYQELKTNNLPKDFTLSPSFPYEKNKEMIQQAKLVFASPGLSTIQEAAYFETPIFFLPEQNVCQSTGFQSLKKVNYPVEYNNFTLSHHLKEDREDVYEYDIEAFYSKIETLLQKDPLPILNQFKQTCIPLEKLAKEQREKFIFFSNGFEGAKEIATEIMKR